MAFGISRRCITAICHQPGPSLTLVGPSRFTGAHSSSVVRSYATQVIKQRQKAKKPTGASNIDASKPTAKVASRTTAKRSEARPAAPQGSATAAIDTRRKAAAGMTYTIPEKKDASFLTEEQQMAQVEQIMSMGRIFPTADPWGQRVETLDVMIPYSTKLTHRRNYPSWAAMMEQFKKNRYNTAKNVTSLLMLAQENAIPGVDLSESTRVQKYITKWPRALFSTTSIKNGSWMMPLREAALKSYNQLNIGLARQDDKAIKEVSTSVYQDHIMRLLKKQHPQYTYVWRLHRQFSPVRVLSIRATEGYLASEDPKFGNRMMIHALMRFDTEQSLEIYDRQGNPCHTLAANTDEPNAGKYPAAKRRVTEYLIFEKRMWYDGPWVIREQLWEAPGKDPAL